MWIELWTLRFTSHQRGHVGSAITLCSPTDADPIWRHQSLIWSHSLWLRLITVADKRAGLRKLSRRQDSTEMRNQCWETIHHRIFSLHTHLVTGRTNCFWSRLSLKGCSYSKQPWKIKILSLWSNGQFFFLPVLKDLEPQCCFRLQGNPLGVQVSPGPLFIILWELRFRSQHKKIETLTTALPVSNKQLCLWSRSVLVFLPAFKKLARS